MNKKKSKLWLFPKNNGPMLMVMACILFVSFGAKDAHAQKTNFYRLAGENRYQTAAAVSCEGWRKSYYVLLVSGQDFADALCAGPLAKKLCAPILLTEPERLPKATISELKRLEAEHIIIIGGPQAVNPLLENELKQEGIKRIERISGRDRYETSVRIAENLAVDKEIILVSGQNPWDAMAINTIAVSKELPVLLTEKDHLSSVVQSYLQQRNINKTIIIGGSEVISPALEPSLPGFIRIAGEDRYGTNIRILEECGNELDFSKIYAVNGDNGVSDALCISSLAGKAVNPVILTKDRMPKEMEDFLNLKISLASRIILVGGEEAVPEEVGIYFKQLTENVPKTVFQNAGTFGPENKREMISGNVLISRDGVKLQNTVIEGDLFLADAIGEGRVSLCNVIVKGNTIICGGGVNSVIFYDFRGQKITVEVPEGQRIRLVAQGNTDIGQVIMHSGGILEEFDLLGSGFTDIRIPDGVDLTLRGQFARVDLDTGGTGILVADGSRINVLNLNATAALRGSGVIAQANINSPGITLEQTPLCTNIREGVRALIGGLWYNQGTIFSDRGGDGGQTAYNESSPSDTTAPSAVNISGRNLIPADGSLELRAVDGPLSDSSWTKLLAFLQANTGADDYWISGIEAADLTITPSADGQTALLHNNSSQKAFIRHDFIIPGGSLADRSGNVQDIDIIIDSYLETEVLHVSSNNTNGFYKAGDKIEITIAFSRNVTVEGEPTLQLETGATGREASYSDGSGTDLLTFTYTVMPGDSSSSLDYLSINALRVDDGAITDSDNLTAAVLVLPVPGEAGSLSSAKHITIDTEAPTNIKMAAANIIPGNGSILLAAEGGPLSDASWDDILAEIKANTGRGENWISGVAGDDLNITPDFEGSTALLVNRSTATAVIKSDFIIPAVSVRDKAGNQAPENIIIAVYGLVKVLEVRSPTADGFYRAGSAITVEVVFDGAVTVTGTSALSLETGESDSLALYTGGSGTNRLSFSYIVKEGDTSPDLEYTSPNALTGMIKIKDKDAEADLTLPNPGAVGSLGQEKNIIIDTTPPSAITISVQDSIPAGGQALLTSVEGPLTYDCWAGILISIKTNTITGNWISDISSKDLTLNISVDGVTAILENNSSDPAELVRDFVIPAAQVVDRAGNSAAGDIRINACSHD